MEFHLFYKGKLKVNGDKQHKQEIRRYFHPQLKRLWEQEPLMSCNEYLKRTESDSPFLINVGDFTFVPLVNQKVKLIAELDIVMLRPEAPGKIITQTGDIDNRLKTLFDALRMPQNNNEIPKGDTPKDDEKLFFCLLEDDNLITHLSVTTDRLLEQVNNDLSEVILLIHIHTKFISPTINFFTLGI